jgi:uncharacterized protein (TIGR01777 family)
MRIVVAGGTGFLGNALCATLAREGHEVIVLSRSAGGESRRGVRHLPWQPDGGIGTWADALTGADAVVNLAGAGVADARWTAARKVELRASRLLATQSLVAAIRHSPAPPRVFLSGSAIGYYGPRGDEPVTEASPPGDDFLARLVVEWEEAAAPAASPQTRLVLLRTGIVLGRGGGALAQMLPPFKLGIAGPLGSGAQWMSWIHLDDWVAMMQWLLLEPRVRGAVNLTGPEPATNRDLSRALGRALHRPAVVPVPAFALRLLYGEFADTLLTGQRVLPSVAHSLSFGFRFPALDAALADLVR